MSSNLKKRIIKAIKDPKELLYYIMMTHSNLFKIVPDKAYIKLEYSVAMKKKLNLNAPKTFNEKIQWLKLYDRRPMYTKMVDKYEAKIYAGNIIGDEYIIPTLGVWNSFDEIDFKSLPNKFVLKCTHDSGGIVICKDKESFDYNKAKTKINSSLRREYFYSHREWPYKNVKPRIIAEQYMEDTTSKDLKDYKFFTFNGDPRLLFVASDRQKEDSETKFDFYDMNFNHLDIKNGHPNSDKGIECPKTFDKMKELARKLSQGIPQVRVDFYEVNGHVYFGELTFSHYAGIVPFSPEKWDDILGEWIELPKTKVIND